MTSAGSNGVRGRRLADAKELSIAERMMVDSANSGTVQV